jgi:uncharacterized protein (TIGR03437 family)
VPGEQIGIIVQVQAGFKDYGTSIEIVYIRVKFHNEIGAGRIGELGTDFFTRLHAGSTQQVEIGQLDCSWSDDQEASIGDSPDEFRSACGKNFAEISRGIGGRLNNQVKPIRPMRVVQGIAPLIPEIRARRSQRALLKAKTALSRGYGGREANEDEELQAAAHILLFGRWESFWKESALFFLVQTIMHSINAKVVLAAGLLFLSGGADGQNSKTVFTISTVAGGNSAGDGGLAAQALLSQPEGVTIDGRGYIYVADADDNRVRRINLDGTIQTVAGTGIAGFSGDGGPAEAAQLNAPYGLTVDRTGNLYIADLGNARVRKLGTDGRISTFAGGGQIIPGGSGDGGIASGMKLSAPRNVAADAFGNVFIADFTGQRVYRVSSNGSLTTVAGSGVAGFSGDGLPATLAKLAYPAGLAVDAKGTLYIGDTGNNRVRTVSGNVIGTLGDMGKAGNVTIPLNAPTGLALDRAGNLYIQDGRNTTLRIGGGGTITVLAIGGRDIALDSSDAAYATSPGSLKKFVNGKLSDVAGGGVNAAPGDGGDALGGRFKTPLGILRDPFGGLFVADSGNGRVRRITAGVLSTFAGTAATSAIQSTLATATKLGLPYSVAMNSRGDVFISDTTANRIRRVGADGSVVTIAGSDEAGGTGDGWFAVHATLDAPAGLAMDQNDNLYIADAGNGRVRKITPEGTIYTVAGGGNSLNDGGLASEANLSKPAGLAVDRNGNLYIADTGHDRIRLVDKSGKIRTFGVAVGGNLLTGLKAPRGLKVAANGDAIVADAGNNRVVKIGVDGTVDVLAGTGIAGFTGDGAAGNLAALNTPSDVLLELDGSVWISDSGNNRIRKLTPQVVAPVIVPPAVVAPVIVPPAAVVKLTVAHGASLLEMPVAPGEIITLFGSGLGPTAGVSGKLTADGILGTKLGGTEVLFDGLSAPLFYAQDKQVNVQVPFGVAGRAQTVLTVQVNGGAAASAIVPVLPAVPGLVTSGNGAGQAIAVNEDGSVNSASNPAPRGTIVTFYATGDGQIGADSRDGQPATAGATPFPVSLMVGGCAADILYAGKAPGQIGLMQINARIAAGFAPTGILNVLLTVNGANSQPGVTLAVR